MTAPAQSLKLMLEALPDEDRAELAHFLIASLDHENDMDVEASWDAELERRKAEILSGKAKGRSAEQVFADLDKRFQ